MTAAAFVLEPARCTGCGACAVACTLENHLPAGGSWRKVHAANPDHRPGAPAFHLALACHHCERPACLEGCPAAAYRRDPATGAVLLDGAACIGCRYCGWTCPYDAPVFDAAAGTMGKCTFCAPRLQAGRAPACAQACPTGALGTEPRGSLPEPRFPGLPRRGLGPALRLAGAAPAPPRTTAPPTAAGLAWLGAPAAPAARVGWRSEWSLLAFTTLVPLLVGLQLAAAVKGARPLGAFPVLPLGVLAAALALVHLGRPARAWRALAHLRRSWLSREILAFALFLPLAAGLDRVPAGPPAAAAAALLGLALLVCVDRVYQVAEGRPPWRLHSAEALPAGLFLAGVLGGLPALLVPVALLRLGAFLARRRDLARARALVPAAVRAAALLLPGLALGGGGTPSPALVALVLLGEVLDRAAFYRGLDLGDPARETAAVALTAAPSGSGGPA